MRRTSMRTLCFAGCLALAALLLSYSLAAASPAAPIDHTIIQPDGSKFTTKAWGDETLHGLETIDGYTIMQDTDGIWVYAALDAQGALVPARVMGQALVVGRHAPITLTPGLRPIMPSADLGQSLELAPSAALAPLNNIGTQRLLIILVNFADQPLKYHSADFAEQAFGEVGSIQHYYLQASFGKLRIEAAAENGGMPNDGIVEVSLPYNHPNTDYGQNAAWDALAQAAAVVDFAAFDTNGDGYVSSRELHLLIIAAGDERSFCSPNPDCTVPAVWGHRGSLYGLVLDGKKVAYSAPNGDTGGYMMVGERHGRLEYISGQMVYVEHMATIGIMVHELGHNLAMPDLYDTSDLSEGVGNWSLMGGGSWNRTSSPGDSPALPDALMKWYQGWITPAQMQAQQSYTLNYAAGSPDALLVGTNPLGVDWFAGRQRGYGEYFLVENRQKKGYDAGLPGCGLLIWHVNEAVTSSYAPNSDRDHPLIALEQADGQNNLYHGYLRGDAGDPYPGSKGNRAFHVGTVPNSKTSHGTDSRVALRILSAGCADAMSLINDTPPLTKRFFQPAVLHTQQYSGTVTRGGEPAAGVTLHITSFDGDGFRDSTVMTSKDGGYSFTPPAVGEGQTFAVWYSGGADELSEWNCPWMQGDLTDSYTCSFDIAPLPLERPAGSPCLNETMTLPYTIEWQPRAVFTESYRVMFCEMGAASCCYSAKTPARGSSLTLNALPPGIKTGTAYMLRLLITTQQSNAYGVMDFCGTVQFAG